jgi:hypothetical protein
MDGRDALVSEAALCNFNIKFKKVEAGQLRISFLHRYIHFLERMGYASDG